MSLLCYFSQQGAVMIQFKSGNHALDARWKRAALDDVLPTKRSLVYAAVRSQLEDDNKAPWSLGQKLNDTPYRYTRDTLWAALNSISGKLVAGNPKLIFGTEDKFQHPTIQTFAEFVNTQLTQTVSALIGAIMEASRWP